MGQVSKWDQTRRQSVISLWKKVDVVRSRVKKVLARPGTGDGARRVQSFRVRVDLGLFANCVGMDSIYFNA